MKTVDQMRKDLKNYCYRTPDCVCCPMEGKSGFCDEYDTNVPDSEIQKWHKEFFPEQYQNDPVNHPAHYNNGKIEVADFIADQRLNFDRGNAVKYLCRAGAKDPACEIQDLEKASWYIKHEIKTLKERNNDRN